MTSLRLGFEPPSETRLKAYAVKINLASRPFNHGFMPGGSKPEPVKALRLVEKTAVIGHGKNTYARAQTLLLDWKMHGSSRTTGIWTDGDALVTYAQGPAQARAVVHSDISATTIVLMLASARHALQPAEHALRLVSLRQVKLTANRNAMRMLCG